MLKRFFIFTCLIFLICAKSAAQYTTGVTGLLHMPSAEMQEDGTFMIGGNYMNKKNLPNPRRWQRQDTRLHIS